MSFPDDGSAAWFGNSTSYVDYPLELLGDPGGFVDLPPLPSLNGYISDSHKGLDPVVQVFYEGPEKCECCINWIEKPPAQIPDSEKTKYEKAAICVYKRKNHEHHASRKGGLITLTDERIVIQSRTLLDAIRPAFHQSDTIVPKQGDMKFEYPFRELYFNFDKIAKVQDSLPHGEEPWKHVNLLMGVVGSLLGPMTWDIQQLHSKCCITYEYLWTLFPPSMIVYHKHRGQERLLKVTSTEKVYSEYRTNWSKAKDKTGDNQVEIALKIHFQYFGFDGTNFGVTRGTYTIPLFEGEKLIDRLDVYPLAFHIDGQFAERCLQRGAKVLDFQDTTHCYYVGSAREVEGHTCLLESRVIVDCFHFSKDHLDEIEIMEPPDELDSGKVYRGNEDFSHEFVDDTVRNSSLKLPHIDFYLDKKPTKEVQHLNRRYFEAYPDALKLMDPDIPGYALRHNKWFWLDVTKLSPIKWTSKPLDRLVLKQSTKSILSSFAQNHQKILNMDADVLAAKGSGMVILLSGTPGTGKTLTAEAIAEEARLPLYRILAGELGSTPTNIESRLTEVLDLATKWQAIVLLDEADTFIQKRQASDRISSEIVSIFLRQLEYFRGIMFLTTNRAGDIDTALRSRCRLHILYDDLSTNHREEVWKIQFRKAGLEDGTRKAADGRPVRISLKEEDWKTLFAWRLSGRDIHNVMENAILWCTVQCVDMTLERLEEAIKVTTPLAVCDAINTRMPELSDYPVTKRPRTN